MLATSIPVTAATVAAPEIYAAAITPRPLPPNSVDFARVGRGELVRAYRTLRLVPRLGDDATIDPHPMARIAHPLAVLALRRWNRWHPGALSAEELAGEVRDGEFVPICAAYAGISLAYAQAFDAALCGRHTSLTEASLCAVVAGYQDGCGQRSKLRRWAEALERHALGRAGR